MAELVNLRQHRKRKAREENAKHAEQNRSRFGESKSDREIRLSELAKAGKQLDGHRLAHNQADSGD